MASLRRIQLASSSCSHPSTPIGTLTTVKVGGARDQYRQTLLRGTRAAAKKPTNLSKVSETIQGPTEAPATCLERLFEAYRLYTPVDPAAPENRRAVHVALATQSAPDVRRKVQKLEGFEGKLLSELVDIAQKIHDTQEDPSTMQTEPMAKIPATAMAGAEEEGKGPGHVRKPKSGGTGRVRAPLHPRQCACCKEFGHWRRECPRRLKEEGKKPPEPILLEDTT